MIWFVFGGIVVFLGVVWLLMNQANKKGKIEQEIESLESIIDDMGLAKRVDEDINKLSPIDKRNKLRESLKGQLLSNFSEDTTDRTRYTGDE